ncbi:MAG: 6,7-dimethyl-8-ribityllumazine synthase [Acidimicrobiales bacterium]|nr:6,7-dimethyl-8-ribityllumazine synthase [Acidimicrobiales bacterium]
MKTPVVDGRGRILSSVKTISGALTAEGINVGIVCGRFNDLITDRLLDGAVDSLQRLGVSPDNVTVAWVPGAFEAPVVARAMANRDDIDGVICLGAVIRGATSHYDFVAGQAAAGLQRAALDSGKPVIFGILTTDTLEQALDRAGAKVGNKGAEAAVTLVETLSVLRQLDP